VVDVLTNVPLGDKPGRIKARDGIPGMPLALAARRTSAPRKMGMNYDYVNGI
jgi:hypothetical protein